MNQHYLSEYFKFIYNRQEIWFQRHFNQPKPWSEDEIFNKYKFCNVYRELDKTTIHLIDKVINNENLNLPEKVLNILIFRRFNTHYFYEHFPVIKSASSIKELIKLMTEEKQNGLKLFNDAYTVCQVKFDATKPKDKHIQHLLMLEDAFNNGFLDFNWQNNLQNVFNKIKTLSLTGNFLSYQCAIDISYITRANVNLFVDVGPGCLQACELINKGVDPLVTCFKLYYMQEEMFGELKLPWQAIKYKTPYNSSDYLSLNNIENCLCEFRKYNNLKHGNKQRKRYYKGGDE